MAYREGARGSTSVLIWFDRSGKQGRTVGDAAAAINNFQFSPDRKNVAAAIQERTGADIWIYDVARGLRTRFTFDAASDDSPVWSPDGRSIIFRSNRKQTTRGDLYRKAVDTQFSPDGRWIAYRSNESQRNEIYITPFPPPPSGPAGKRQVSVGGVFPFGRFRWREDGKEIFYVGLDQRLMSADVAIKAGTLEIGAVRPLFSMVREDIPSFDVSADGQRFLLRASPEEKSSQPLTLIQNWPAALRPR